ncbi:MULTISPECIES: histidine kinase [unclassified Spirosoma]|uniref:ATP-binding protein n=1 Tax=unclassified Spirosoma TaxID=2621999 RepID=UPI000967232E|nr:MULTISPECIES: histidine kinase [unclassified Spirosoma]MBN8824038.1 type IV pili methyl-accepting chemotaxis transducer N-terminal domain-containing protein [Spirosoma sp.]OJW70442.1 MAG: histidine kinase [Spirosoma sp. 48-14]
MYQLDQQVARRLTRFYVIALTVIAMLSLGGLWFIKRTLSNHYDDGRVVNVAGRQRMLSQRLTKLAILRAEGIAATDTVSFDSLLYDWHQTHDQLRQGKLQMEKEYAVRKSATLDSMFNHIEPYFQAMYQGFSRISLAEPIGRKEALPIILQNELSFLQQMDAIVFQFDTESFQRVRTLERIEWLLTIATVLTLLIEGLFIFQPVVNHTKAVISRLAKSEQSLQRTNQRLEIANHELEATNQNLAYTNQKLLDTQQELVRTTEEKYQLIRAEDRVRSAALLEGQEEERRRFARELHDGIGQMLTGIKLHAEKLKSISLADEKQRQRFAELCDLIADIIQTTRQVSYNLMPSTLSDFGLGPTLQLLAEQTSRSSGIDITFNGPRDAARLNPTMEIGLYRIAQEALHNAVKYANAQSIRINLQQDRHKLALSVQDDGKGFMLKAARSSEKSSLIVNGLENMRTRAQLLNGTLTIQSKPKKGTIVEVIINELS